MSNDVLKCRLTPLNPRHYPVAFTAGQWSRLRATFPHGVCDYSKPGVERVPSMPWQTYAHGPRG